MYSEPTIALNQAEPMTRDEAILSDLSKAFCDSEVTSVSSESSLGGGSGRGSLNSLDAQGSADESLMLLDDDEDRHSSQAATACTSCCTHQRTEEHVYSESDQNIRFVTLRCTYLLVTLVVMLADGLQGTHLYVLYDSYGYSVPALYSLGFFAGGVLSPITGPMIDKIGRKKSAILYCALEVFINTLEQYDSPVGLIASRMIGGFTTNLLSSVFEAWLDTEYRRRGLQQEKYETIMRDSVIVSNSAAIFAGFLAHVLSQRYDAVGPFRGAVVCTAIALVVVLFAWTENYGTTAESENVAIHKLLHDAATEFKKDKKMLRVGILQGLTAGSIQIFIFLWSPILMTFAKNAPAGTLGLDSHGEPNYGLIFGCFMAFGVLGGLCAPTIRKAVSKLLAPVAASDDILRETEVEGEGKVVVRPMAVEFLAAACYIFSAMLLTVPVLVSRDSPIAFTLSLASFLVFEFLLGVFLPCEGVIRSIYYPAEARGSVMTFPRIVVNVAVAACVASTMVISDRVACACVATLMVISACLQLSLISANEWTSLYRRVDRTIEPLRAASFSARQSVRRDSSRAFRRLSDSTGIKMFLKLAMQEGDMPKRRKKD